MTLETLPLVAALLIAAFMLVFWVRIVRDLIWTAVGVVIILAVLFLVFQVGPRQVLQELRDPIGFVEQVWHLILNWLKGFFPQS